MEKFQWVEFEDRLKRLEILFLLVAFQKFETAIDTRMVLQENHDLLIMHYFKTLMKLQKVFAMTFRNCSF